MVIGILFNQFKIGNQRNKDIKTEFVSQKNKGIKPRVIYINCGSDEEANCFIRMFGIHQLNTQLWEMHAYCVFNNQCYNLNVTLREI